MNQEIKKIQQVAKGRRLHKKKKAGTRQLLRATRGPLDAREQKQ